MIYKVRQKTILWVRPSHDFIPISYGILFDSTRLPGCTPHHMNIQQIFIDYPSAHQFQIICSELVVETYLSSVHSETYVLQILLLLIKHILRIVCKLILNLSSPIPFTPKVKSFTPKVKSCNF